MNRSISTQKLEKINDNNVSTSATKSYTSDADGFSVTKPGTTSDNFSSSTNAKTEETSTMTVMNPNQTASTNKSKRKETTTELVIESTSSSPVESRSTNQSSVVIESNAKQSKETRIPTSSVFLSSTQYPG